MHRQEVIAVLTGALVFAVLELAALGLRHVSALHPGALMDPPAYPAWSHVVEQILSGAQAVGSGVVAGWLAKRNGWLVGLAVGLVGRLAALLAVVGVVGGSYIETFDVPWLAGVFVYSCITCAAGGAAGVALAGRGPPSNLSLEADKPKRRLRAV